MRRRRRTRPRSLIGAYPEPDPVTEEPSPWPCPHFPLCGGCQIQHLAYDEQVRLKSRALSRLFQRDVAVMPAPNPFHYRARMDFVTTFSKVGLRRRGNFRKIVDITDCLLISERALSVLRTIRRLKEEHGIPDYDINRQQGFLKYVTLRESRYGELMVIFYTNPSGSAEHAQLERLAAALLDAEWIDSIWWMESEEISDRNQGQRVKHWGAAYIIEEIGGYRYAVGPDTFFQSNTAVAERCFERIREQISGGRVLDLYCGVGTISLFLSAAADAVIGVETVPESVRQAEDNAARNHCANTRFIAREVRAWLKEPEGAFETVVLDPPRAGLGGKVVRRLLRLRAPKIVYMSCNPKTQWEDIQRMEGYQIESIMGYDMFPQTEHVETVATLVRR